MRTATKIRKFETIKPKDDYELDVISSLTATKDFVRLIIGVCILLRVTLTVNNNTFCFATIDKVFY
jgi:hypothetical protein